MIRGLQAHDDGLELGKRLHRVAAADASHARAGPRPSAEGKVALPVVGGGVYVDPAGPHRLGEAQSPRQIPGKDGGEQAVGRGVDGPYGFLLVADDGRRDYRAEGLLLETRISAVTLPSTVGR